MYDVIVVGAGFAGAVIAERLAKKGKKILVIDEREHIGGNVYDEKIDGIDVHMYGPHIFHTNDKEVFDYLSNFTEWYKYEHRVLGHIDGKIVPIPFNFTSIDELFGAEEAQRLKELLLLNYGADQKIAIFELLKSDDPDLKKLAEFIFEKVFKYYTMKQWGLKAQELDSAVMGRVPVVTSYDDRYFKDEYQYLPRDGYTKIFERMLESADIDVRLDTKSEDVLLLEDGAIYFEGERFLGKVVYTGSIDRLFNYAFGDLAYRSLDLDLIKVADTYQCAATENYPCPKEEAAYTRITEYKHFMIERPDEYSYIHIEYPKAYNRQMGDIAYYPIFTNDDEALYDMYLKVANNYPDLILLGRLAEYHYYNMDAIIAKALKVAETLFEA